MTITKAKKEKLKRSKKEIVKFKKERGIETCGWCGYPIEKSPHHFLCWVCWKINKNTSKRNVPKARALRRLQVNKCGREHITI